MKKDYYPVLLAKKKLGISLEDDHDYETSDRELEQTKEEE